MNAWVFYVIMWPITFYLDHVCMSVYGVQIYSSHRSKHFLNQGTRLCCLLHATIHHPDTSTLIAFLVASECYVSIHTLSKYQQHNYPLCHCSLLLSPLLATTHANSDYHFNTGYFLMKRFFFVWVAFSHVKMLMETMTLMWQFLEQYQRGNNSFLNKRPSSP